jgi:hypothetical protein
MHPIVLIMMLLILLLLAAAAVGSAPPPRQFCGIQPSDTLTSSGLPKKGWKVHCFFVKPTGVKLRNPDKWDTYSPEEFCSHCVKVGKTRKNGEEVYRCLGH